MAQPVNTFSSYDQVGIREDLTDVIHNVTPYDTPFYSSVAKTRATNTYHEWQTDSLRSSSTNEHIEGDDTVATARTPTVRLGNYTQIFKDAVTVTGTDSALNKAGRGDEMDYQLVKTGREIRLDIERALLANNARRVGSDVVARRLAGVPAWLFTNTINQTGGTPSGADPIGDGTNARTDDGTPTAFNQTRMNACLESIWTNSNGGARSLTAMLNPFQMRAALTFTGNNAQRNQARTGEVRNVVDVYATPWGEIEFVMSREMRARDVLVLDLSMFKIPVARGFTTEPLAKTGDSERRQIITELTLESCNERASGAVYDNTTA
jgi:hypothetical protein